MAKVYKVERCTTNDHWYEVMLSPFLTVGAAGRYIDEYEKYYPKEDQKYRVLDQQVNGKDYSRLKRFFNRVPNIYRGKSNYPTSSKRTRSLV